MAMEVEHKGKKRGFSEMQEENVSKEGSSGSVDEDEDWQSYPRRSSRKKSVRPFKGDIDTKYDTGTVIWAKLGDFPWWPGKVEWQEAPSESETEGKDAISERKKKGPPSDPGYPFGVQIRWYGVDSDRIDVVNREWIALFDVRLRSRLNEEDPVADLDLPEFEQCLKQADYDFRVWLKVTRATPANYSKWFMKDVEDTSDSFYLKDLPRPPPTLERRQSTPADEEPYEVSDQDDSDWEAPSARRKRKRKTSTKKKSSKRKPKRTRPRPSRDEDVEMNDVHPPHYYNDAVLTRPAAYEERKKPVSIEQILVETHNPRLFALGNKERLKLLESKDTITYNIDEKLQHLMFKAIHAVNASEDPTLRIPITKKETKDTKIPKSDPHTSTSTSTTSAAVQSTASDAKTQDEKDAAGNEDSILPEFETCEVLEQFKQYVTSGEPMKFPPVQGYVPRSPKKKTKQPSSPKHKENDKKQTMAQPPPATHHPPPGHAHPAAPPNAAAPNTYSQYGGYYSQPQGYPNYGYQYYGSYYPYPHSHSSGHVTPASPYNASSTPTSGLQASHSSSSSSSQHQPTPRTHAHAPVAAGSQPTVRSQYAKAPPVRVGRGGFFRRKGRGKPKPTTSSATQSAASSQKDGDVQMKDVQ